MRLWKKGNSLRNRSKEHGKIRIPEYMQQKKMEKFNFPGSSLAFLQEMNKWRWKK